MTSILQSSCERDSFIFRIAMHPGRLFLGLLAGAIVCLAGAALHKARAPAVVSLTQNVTTTRVAMVIAPPGTPAHRDRVAAAAPPRQAVPRPAVRSADPRPHMKAPSFDVVRIADFLRSTPPPRRANRARRPLALTLVRLDTDIVVDAASPPPAVPLSPNQVPAKTETGVHQRSALDGTLDFDSRLGKVTTAARAGTLNGTPAAALNIGLSEGGIRFDAGGTTDMSSLADPAAMRRTFKVSTSASVPLD